MTLASREELQEELRSYIDVMNNEELETLLSFIETHDDIFNSFFTEEVFYFHQ